MRRLSLVLLVALLVAPAVRAQTAVETLESGTTIEKSIAAGQTHSYTLNLEKDQFVQLAVEQRGVDVVVRVFLPNGNLAHEFDSPTGSEGTEYAEVLAESAGAYRVEIAPLGGNETSTSAKYELKVVEWRKATDEELKLHQNDSARKAKARALVVETSQSFDQFRLPETRVTMRIRAAELLWPSDEKQALALIAQASETIKQTIAERTDSEDDYTRNQWLLALRRQVITALAPHDAEAALKFLQATRLTPEKDDDQEVQLESTLIDQVLEKDPKRAFELAEDLLHRTPSQTLVQTLSQLAQKDRDLASRLARDMAKKIEGEDFQANAQAAYLSVSLVQIVKNSFAPASQDGGNAKPARLLSDEEFSALFLKLVSEMMSYKTSTDNPYGPELQVIRNLAGTLLQMQPEVKTYAPDQAEAINKKASELSGATAQPAMDWQRYQTAAMKEPIDTALESVSQAPPSMRDYLYQQVVSRVAAEGDVSRARQLVSERITNPAQKQQMLHTIQQQAVTTAAEKGRFDEALRLLARFPLTERLQLLNQVIEQIGPGVKKADALQYLEQAKNLTSPSIRAENSEQMHTLLAIARAYARLDAPRGFQTIEPLIDQFNEICAAAVTMNGFGGEYYVEGEMTTARDNTLADMANEISSTLATLAMFDFDRAKKDADSISRFDARVRTLLTVAAQVLGIHLEENIAPGRADY
ncbi:MAG TPA: hypothetical protein VE961_19805 [Pyrinomonadaceae bacterium]|nr:hypothetical protein [Pyrinomonadaceae bacterium]